jgi:DNA-binding Xre family transcriptional regulator
MITSTKQIEVAKGKVKLLKDSLRAKTSSGIPKELVNATRGQISELISEIEAEIKEFELLQSTSLEKFHVRSFEDLMLTPIRIRLAQKMTVEEFAHQVGVHSRQIARYEAQNYTNLNTLTLLKIFKKLSAHIDAFVQIPQDSAR